jgi:hypothetical protein
MKPWNSLDPRSQQRCLLPQFFCLLISGCASGEGSWTVVNYCENSTVFLSVFPGRETVVLQRRATSSVRTLTEILRIPSMSRHGTERSRALIIVDRSIAWRRTVFCMLDRYLRQMIRAFISVGYRWNADRSLNETIAMISLGSKQWLVPFAAQCCSRNRMTRWLAWLIVPMDRRWLKLSAHLVYAP